MFGDQGRVTRPENGEDVETTETVPATHELPQEMSDQGGVTLADYEQGEKIRVEGFPDEINELAYQATGTSDGTRDISDGERAVQAVRIDQSIRAHAAWIDSRPLDEQLRLRAQPVITTPGE